MLAAMVHTVVGRIIVAAAAVGRTDAATRVAVIPIERSAAYTAVVYGNQGKLTCAVGEVILEGSRRHIVAGNIRTGSRPVGRWRLKIPVAALQIYGFVGGR